MTGFRLVGLGGVLSIRGPGVGFGDFAEGSNDAKMEFQTRKLEGNYALTDQLVTLCMGPGEFAK